jgi:hypothetical protein
MCWYRLRRKTNNTSQREKMLSLYAVPLYELSVSPESFYSYDVL